MQNACRRGVWLLETTTSLIARISSIAKESHDMCLSKKYLLIRPSFGFCMNPHEWSETNWNVCWVSWTLPSIILLKFFLILNGICLVLQKSFSGFVAALPKDMSDEVPDYVTNMDVFLIKLSEQSVCMTLVSWCHKIYFENASNIYIQKLFTIGMV